jgi:alpha-aminoadipic semialdehyde synthase
MPALPDAPMAPIEIFAYLLAHKMRYKPHERDMVILSHEVITRPKQMEGKGQAHQEEDLQVHTSSLIAYGTPRASAMARTVAIPVAIAALRVLDGKVDVRGVARPDDPSVYGPVLKGLQEVGLGMKESVDTATNTVEAKLIASQIRWSTGS